MAGHRSNEQLLAEAEARAARLRHRIRSKQRTERNRRLLLIGVATERFFDSVNNGDKALQDLLDTHITANRDRVFLALPPREEKTDE